MTLKTIVELEKNKDIGKWRLAVAALATTGYEGQKILLKLKIDKDSLDAVIKGLSKAVSKARTNNLADLDQIKREVEQATQALEIIRYLEIADRHPLLDEYLGNDQISRARFESDFAVKLTQEIQQWGQLPPEESLDRLIEQVIEEMTS